jgi:hypothetical protein
LLSPSSVTAIAAIVNRARALCLSSQFGERQVQTKLAQSWLISGNVKHGLALEPESLELLRVFESRVAFITFFF